MDIAKPAGAGRKEEVTLNAAASYLLEECRMVLPGIQALFGFQLIAVLSDGFDDKLSPGERQLHFLASISSRAWSSARPASASALPPSSWSC